MHCSICQHEKQNIVVGRSPVAGYKCKTLEESLLQESFDMVMEFCPNCKMLNYHYIDEADNVLDRLYSEHTATYYFTPALTAYMNDFVDGLINDYHITAGSSVLEIGCNSGRLLAMFKDKSSCRVLGVEPSKSFSQEWKDQGVEVINEYFEDSIADALMDFNPSLIIFRHVFEHIKDPVNFIKNVAKISSEDTVVVIEVPYFKSVIGNKRIDNIGYSHLNYYTISSVNSIVGKFGMGIVKYKLVETDGGSIVFHIKKNVETNPGILDDLQLDEINNFLGNIKIAREKIVQTMKKYNKGEVVGYGAGAKGSHLIYILGLEDFINVVIDDTPSYNGLFIPKTKIMIHPRDYFINNNIKAVINLAPTHSKDIKSNIPEGVEFIDLII